VPEPPSPPPELDGLSTVRKNAPVLGRNAGNQMRETNLLSQCLHHPKVLNDINARLAATGQTAVTKSDFVTIEDRELFEQLSQRSHATTFVSIDELCDSLDSPLLERAQHLQSLPPTPDSELDRLADKLVLSVLDIRHEKTRRLNKSMQHLVTEAKQIGDSEAVETYQAQSLEISRQLLHLQQAKNAMSSVSKRRAEEASLGHF
jgi:hypothetical protein